MSNLCTESHVCQHCKKATNCSTYRWACPWVNDDEEQLCSVCTETLVKEEEEAYYGV